MEVQELDWYNPALAQEALHHGPFDMLVAADCVYNEEHLPALRYGSAGPTSDIPGLGPHSATIDFHGAQN